MDENSVIDIRERRSNRSDKKCTVVLGIKDPETEGKAWKIDLNNTFSEVFDNCFPIEQIQNTMELRKLLIFETHDGKKMCIRPELIQVVYEREE